MALTNNREFNRVSGNMADTGIKAFFKWFGIGIKALSGAVKSIISSILGK